jgi:hypothetical protein
MADDFNPQDYFISLCEDCRLGQVGRPIATFNPNGVRFVPHRPDCNPNVPCFYFGEDAQLDVDVHHAACETIIDGTFALPYDSFAAMISVPPHHGALREAPRRFQDLRHSYVLVVEQVSDETILLHPFMRNASMKHWARQVFDLKLTLAGEQSEMICQPLDTNFPEDFLAGVQFSLEQRVDGLLTQIHRLMVGHGRVTHVAPNPTLAAAIAKRRAKALVPLPPIPPVRIIDLDHVPAYSTGGKGNGSAKRPHWRRGTWVREHVRRGKLIPAGPRRGTQVHRGGAMPWYEVRQ